MDTQKIQPVLETLSDHLVDAATVKKVYGEPIVSQGKTIIPIARVALGFGGGFGERNGKRHKDRAKDENPPEPVGEGGGLGGGLLTKPIGVLEITPDRTRFIPLSVTRYVVFGAALCLLLGRILSRMTNRPR
jgi:uncharacterized spore protein YtfJ